MYQDEHNESLNLEENQTADSPPHILTKIYNIIDWIDVLFVIAVVVYWVNPDRFISIPNIGLILGFLSLAICISAVVVAILIFKKGINKSKIRLIVRFIIWGVWIPLDIIFIAQFFVG